ncbi:hypothetical protein [Alkalilimnicola ehrlichii]|uniref:hypothetical protein n=1 Tax=Alkalilimnicola ehrlichii TaxID=351052 RepID=UPI0015F269A1|nr:hypothetical protein [Alkalilimnicola ehrlichii]
MEKFILILRRFILSLIIADLSSYRRRIDKAATPLSGASAQEKAHSPDDKRLMKDFLQAL